MAFIMTRSHGNEIVPERLGSGNLVTVNGAPYTDIVGLAQGWGKTFRLPGGNRSNWFHLSIPSVANLDGANMYLDQFYIFFQTPRFAEGGITELHLYDGSARLAAWNFPTMQGDWSWPHTLTLPSDETLSNTFFPRRHFTQRLHIYTALSISVKAQFLLEGNITFHSAGASWVDQERADF